MVMLDACELILIGNRDEARGFLGKCLIRGIDFHWQGDDQLPPAVPTGLRDVRALVIDEQIAARDPAAIDACAAAGARVYRMRSADPTMPNVALSWTSEAVFHAICFDANLTLHHPRALRRLQQRDANWLLAQLAEHVLQSDNTLWYDATRYQWEAMLDACEVLDDPRYLDRMREQARHMIDTQPNDLSNCDCVAPLIPILRLHEIDRDQRLLDYARQSFDRYLATTPRFRGCLVNFNVYPNHARSEILWQVLPGLMLLAHATGEAKYARLALEQFQRLHELLFDSNENLWSHGVGDGPRSPGFWARGEAFALLANLLVLEMAPSQHENHLRDTFVRCAARLRDLQTDRGFWCCVVDRPESEEESSGTAWIGAALQRAIRLGILDSSYTDCADRAWSAVKSRIWQGTLFGHMAATTISSELAYYAKKPLSDEGRWAHFALRLAAERRRRPRKETL